jgi:HPr kinase/phosphorylase
MAETLTLHGSCVSIDGRGVLLLGMPGAGKSDLVLRLIDQPGCGLAGILRSSLLVADDQVVIARQDGRLIASAPGALSGKLEVRGLGIVAVNAAASAPLSLAVRLCPLNGIERLPAFPGTPFCCLGLELPLVLIDPSAASAPARVRAALDHLGRP